MPKLNVEVPAFALTNIILNDIKHNRLILNLRHFKNYDTRIFDIPHSVLSFDPVYRVYKQAKPLMGRGLC